MTCSRTHTHTSCPRVFSYLLSRSRLANCIMSLHVPPTPSLHTPGSHPQLPIIVNGLTHHFPSSIPHWFFPLGFVALCAYYMDLTPTPRCSSQHRMYGKSSCCRRSTIAIARLELNVTLLLYIINDYYIHALCVHAASTKAPINIFLTLLPLRELFSV